jgi:hypothetical protein
MTILKRLISIGALLALAACGGGGGGGGTPFGGPGTGTGGGGSGGGTGGGNTTAPTISVSVAPNTVTAAAPGTVTARIVSGTGAGIPGQVVEFTTGAGLGRLSAPSALTDADGTATVTVSPTSASTNGADLVRATATVNTTVLTGTAGFQLTATDVTITGFTADIGTGALSAYGQTTLIVNLSAAAQGSPVTVNLPSECVSQGKATLTPSSATTTTGSTSFVFRDEGCGANGSDRLTASVAGSAVAPTPLTLTLTQPTVASISFISASPETIFLRGSGFVENSTVTFRVLDAAGNGVRGQTVNLRPTTFAGDLRVDDAAEIQFAPGAIYANGIPKETDANGNVVVRVNSGTVPTPVRIRATLNLNGAEIATVSSTLAVAVGLPSQLNFSLSQGTRNIEGYDRDGTPNTYTIIGSDRLGNPVPDGTAINFVTEGGQVQAIRFTETSNGLSSAVANFQTSSPRPDDGRVTVLAYALGEKSFLDNNGDNIHTSGELFQDLGNPFLDRLYNGFYGSAPNQFIVQTPTGVLECETSPEPLLARGVSTPTQPNTCNQAWGRAYVRRAIETVFSTSTARPLWGISLPAGAAASTCPAPLSLIRENSTAAPAYDINGVPQRRNYYAFGSTGVYDASRTGIVSFIVADANPVAFNPMAAGTVITVAGTQGMTVSVAGGSPVPSSGAPTSAAVNYSFADGTNSGTMTVSFRSPSGLTTAYAQFISTGVAPFPACP